MFVLFLICYPKDLAQNIYIFFLVLPVSLVSGEGLRTGNEVINYSKPLLKDICVCINSQGK